MGFLSSPLTESRQAAVQNSFALGLQMADATIRQNQAAAEQMKAAEQQHLWAQQAYQQQKADTLAYRKELANERLKEATEKSAEDLTKAQISAGITSITRSGDTMMRTYDDIIANKQGMYSPSTVAQADDLIRKIQRTTALGIQSLAGVKPGEKVDITPTLQALGDLPKINYEYDPSFLEERKANTAAKTAYAGSLTGKNTPEKEPDWIAGVSDSMAAYRSAQQSLADRQNNIDADVKSNAQLNGRDPFAPEVRAVATARIPVTQWGAAARRALQNDNSNLGDTYRALVQQGIDPFDPDSAGQVGPALYKMSQDPRLSGADPKLWKSLKWTDEDTQQVRGDIDKFSTIITGKPASSFAPVTPMGLTIPGIP